MSPAWRPFHFDMMSTAMLHTQNPAVAGGVCSPTKVGDVLLGDVLCPGSSGGCTALHPQPRSGLRWATCTSARIALHASAIPYQPGIAGLAAQLALEVVHPDEPGLVQVTLRASRRENRCSAPQFSWWSRRSPGGRLGRRRVTAVKLRRYAAPGRRFLVHRDTRR
jgi:hypothetical protein